MKAITLWEPWATLVAYGYKRFETRGWVIRYRGPLVIHAAKRVPRLEECSPAPIRRALVEIGLESAADFPLGCALAVVRVTGCYRTEAVLAEGMVQGNEVFFGDYGPDRFAWRLEDLRRLARPAPLRGRQGLWRVREDEEAVIFQYEEIVDVSID